MKQTKPISAKTSLFLLTYPIFIELLLQMLVGNVDQFMISRYSDNAVAAIGNVNQIINLVFIMFSVLATATTILVSQYLGAGEHGKLSELYTVAVSVNLAFGLIIGIVLTFLARPLFTLMQTPPELIEDAVTYLSIVGSGIFLIAVFSTFGAIFRANGLVTQTMLVSLSVNVLNIIGNSLLLYGWWGLPRLGVVGVAISSVASRTIGVILLMLLFRRFVPGSISLKHLRPFPVKTLKRLLRIGLPSGGESLSYSMAQTMMLGMANTIGATTVSTRVYALMLSWFSFIYAGAVSQGTQVIVGHMIGAGQEDDADRRVRKSLIPAVMVTILMSTTLWLSSKTMFSIFTDNPEIIALGQKIMLVEIFLEIGRTINLIVIRALQASGDVRFPVYVGMVSMWGVAVGLGYLLGIHFGLGLVGIWIGLTVDELLRAVIMLVRWHKGYWRGRSLVKEAAT